MAMGIQWRHTITTTLVDNACGMKKSNTEPWMSAPDYARTLTGLSVNLLVRDVRAHVAFARGVLGLEVVYSDADIAVYRRGAAEWMVHADHTYLDSGNPLDGVCGEPATRGAGAELRVHQCDPDAAEAAARAAGFRILAASEDKPHGLREAYIRDTDGYVWVPDVPVDTA